MTIVTGHSDLTDTLDTDTLDIDTLNTDTLDTDTLDTDTLDTDTLDTDTLDIDTLHPEQRPFLNRVFSDILIVNCLTAADQCPFAAVLPPIE